MIILILILINLIFVTSLTSSFIISGTGNVISFWTHANIPASSSSLDLGNDSVSITNENEIHTTWKPQDLTKSIPGYLSLPDNDYIKKYQTNSKLWPVEFFVIAYRHQKKKQQQMDDDNNNNNNNKKTITKNNMDEIQILVRKSANGTSKWGLGTGVPATRWMLSTSKPPIGYQLSKPRITFDANNYPEFPKDCNNNQISWTYDKIDMCKDAFNGPNVASELKDLQLEEYAKNIRDELSKALSEKMIDDDITSSTWDSNLYSTIKNVVDNDNSVAAIQGTLRMSGLFEQDLSSSRFINLNNAPDPTNLMKNSMRIYTMFPQMPDPMPLPTSTQEELQNEIISRQSRMIQNGRDPHKDRYGRMYTHISTSNVSNTIHGIYFIIDTTEGTIGDNDDDDEVIPYALDLFGTKQIKREWKSLVDLKILDSNGNISTDDPKSTFISGFIVRQLVKEGVIS